MNKRLFYIVLIFGILVFSGCNTPADEQSMISDSASNTTTVSSTTDTTDTTSTTVTTTSITSATTMKTTTTKRTTTTTSRKQTTTSKTTRGTSGTITEPLDKISDETFIELVQNDNNAIYQSLYIIEGKEYGRVISSSDSKEDAVNVCTRHFTDTRMPPYTINTVKKCTVIYESAILYGLHVAWETRGQVYEENVISFKSSVADITARNVVYGDEESFRIHTTAQEDIQTIVLYLSHDTYLGQTMLDYDMKTYENEYVMTVYSYEICRGDWGLKDEYTLLKHTIIVHKTTGIVDCQEPITIKTVYVDGALTNIGEVVVDY